LKTTSKFFLKIISLNRGRVHNTTGDQRTSHNRGRENITQQEKKEHHTARKARTSHNRDERTSLNRGREH
jgi:hypothetical protein